MAEAESNRREVLKAHIDYLLSSRDYPKTICPSEVPRALTAPELKACGASDWRSLMPAVRDILWDMREQGQVEILQKGVVVPQGVAPDDVKGPLRARKVVSAQN
ncbi:hypothetical protein BDR22DRAFT_890729 [Usnea florida]